MLIVPLLVWLLLGIPMHLGAMDREEPQETEPSLKESNKNKVRFARDVFTAEKSWDFALSHPDPLISYRRATTVHKISAPSAPADRMVSALEHDAAKKNIPLSQPTIFYENETHKFVGCQDGTIHILNINEDGILHHEHLNCHDKSITSMAHLSKKWLAVGGGKNITFFNLQDYANCFRISFEKGIHSIVAMKENNGTLLCKTYLKRQIIVYPYSTEVYNTLHGADLSDQQKEVLFLAAHAFYEKKQLNFNPAEQRKYHTIVPSLRALITFFFESMPRQQ